MNFLEFLIQIFKIISIDVISGFIIWFIYKFIDLKYFSELEITKLKIENDYLKEENKKLNGTSTFIDKDDNLWFRVFQDCQEWVKMFMLHI